MGWKCNDCHDHGPEFGVLWCPDCGSRNVSPTDRDGLTEADRREQEAMTVEEIALADSDPD